MRNAKQNQQHSQFKLSFYANDDIEALNQTAYKSDMNAEELKSRRKRDWLFILVGVPLLIGIIYLIALLSKAG